MQPEQNNQKQISRVLNINELNPVTIQSLQQKKAGQQLESGNLYIGSIGSLKPQILKKYNITSVVSVINKARYVTYNLQQKILHMLFNIKLDLKEQKDMQNYDKSKYYKLMDERHLFIDIDDKQNANISKHFEKSYKFILQNLMAWETNEDLKQRYGIFVGKTYQGSAKDKKKKVEDNMQGGNVLIHCMGGVSRSATILLSFFIRHYFEMDSKSKLSCKKQGNQTEVYNQIFDKMQKDKPECFDPAPSLQCFIQYMQFKHPFTRPNNGFLKQLRKLHEELKFTSS